MNYIDAIGTGFPAVKCHASGDLYSDLIWDAGEPIPSQATLDAWIAANPDAATDKRITVLALLNRFTGDEHIQIQLAMAWAYDLAQSMQLRAAAASLTANIMKATSANYIDLSLEENITGIGNLEYFPSPLGTSVNANGMLLQTGRASQVLNNPILPNERPTIAATQII
jgi:hypothetical protein